MYQFNFFSSTGSMIAYAVRALNLNDALYRASLTTGNYATYTQTAVA